MDRAPMQHRRRRILLRVAIHGNAHGPAEQRMRSFGKARVRGVRSRPDRGPARPRARRAGQYYRGHDGALPGLYDGVVADGRTDDLADHGSALAEADHGDANAGAHGKADAESHGRSHCRALLEPFHIPVQRADRRSDRIAHRQAYREAHRIADAIALGRSIGVAHVSTDRQSDPKSDDLGPSDTPDMAQRLAHHLDNAQRTPNPASDHISHGEADAKAHNEADGTARDHSGANRSAGRLANSVAHHRYDDRSNDSLARVRSGIRHDALRRLRRDEQERERSMDRGDGG
mmetsp:Transcript_1009/g.2429  ORF Transcript_1009/g.2429 Transcript_1009/m.2429 type:complete len:289 (+) Transcript_1009:212-1078(+)